MVQQAVSMVATSSGLPTARVQGVVGFGGGGPAFGQVGFAERVGGEPFLADGVAEAFVQDAAGEVCGAGGFAVEAGGSVASHPDHRNRSWRQCTQNRRNDTLTDP